MEYKLGKNRSAYDVITRLRDEVFSEIVQKAKEIIEDISQNQDRKWLKWRIAPIFYAIVKSLKI